MKKYVLTTIVASMLSCSLLLAEDTTTQQVQPVMNQGSKMTCCKMKNCNLIKDRAERVVAKLKAKAEKAKASGDTQLAELFTNCADAKQKVADAAKAAAACGCGDCGTDKDSAEVSDMMKQCNELCGKLTAAQDEAAQADSALRSYKKANKKMKKDSKQVAPATTETPS